MRAPLLLSSDREVLVRPWAGPLVVNAAGWPAGCDLLGTFDVTVPGRDAYTVRAGSGRAVDVPWRTLAADGNVLDVTVAFGQARVSSEPNMPMVPSPSPAPPIP